MKPGNPVFMTEGANCHRISLKDKMMAVEPLLIWKRFLNLFVSTHGIIGGKMNWLEKNRYQRSISALKREKW